MRIWHEWFYYQLCICRVAFSPRISSFMICDGLSCLTQTITFTSWSWEANKQSIQIVLTFPQNSSIGWLNKWVWNILWLDVRWFLGPAREKCNIYMFSVQCAVKTFDLISQIIMIFIAQYYIMLLVFFFLFIPFSYKIQKYASFSFPWERKHSYVHHFFCWNVYGKEAKRLKNPMLNIIIRAKVNTQQFKL